MECRGWVSHGVSLLTDMFVMFLLLPSEASKPASKPPIFSLV